MFELPCCACPALLEQAARWKRIGQAGDSLAADDKAPRWGLLGGHLMAAQPSATARLWVHGKAHKPDSGRSKVAGAEPVDAASSGSKAEVAGKEAEALAALSVVRTNSVQLLGRYKDPCVHHE